MKKREPGLDLIRCTAFFFVVLFHSFLQNGFYNEAQTGLLMLFYNSVRWLSVSCIGLFLMLKQTRVEHDTVLSAEFWPILRQKCSKCVSISPLSFLSRRKFIRSKLRRT